MPSAKSGCPMRLTESSAEACPGISFPAAGREPDRRTAGTESGAAPFAAFSNRSFFWSAVSAGNGCPTRYDAPYGNYAWKPPWRSFPAVSRYPDRRTLGTEPGPAPFAATPPTARSFGVLFMRKADARCAIRKSSVEIYLGVSFPAAGREPDRTSGRREWNPAQRLVAAFSNRLPHWKPEFEVLCLRGARAGLTPAVALPAAFVSFAESGAIWPGISLLCAPCRLSRVRCAGSGRFCGAFPLDPP